MNGSTLGLTGLERLGGVAGLAFVALAVTGGVVQGDVPVFTDEPDTIRDWYRAHSDRYLVGGYLLFLGAVCYVAFLAALVTLLRRADPESPWPWLALLAGAHLVVAVQASLAFDGTLALLEGDVSPEHARTLAAGDYLTFLLLYPFAGIHAVAVSLSIRRSRVLSPRLIWFGPPIALAGVVATAAPLQHDAEGLLTLLGYATLMAFAAWTAALALSMLRAPARS